MVCFSVEQLMPKKLTMNSKFVLMEFLITTQIANTPFIYDFDNDDKQFYVIWRTFDKRETLQLSTHCFVFGQEYLSATH